METFLVTSRVPKPRLPLTALALKSLAVGADAPLGSTAQYSRQDLVAMVVTCPEVLVILDI